jgi:predicted DNA-binding protein
MGVMMNKKGRPSSGEARKYGYRVMLNEEEEDRLERLSKEHKKSKADILRIGLLVYESMNKY